MLYPQTGWTFCNAWNSPSLYPWTANMAKWHLLQITSMLHFNNNSDHDGIWRDSLHKVRPLLEIIKKALAWYATPGSEFSFDKATMACYSRYGRGQLSFNPKKPIGMFHFKIYMLCCAVTNLTYKICIHTKDGSEKSEENEENDEEQNTKTDNWQWICVNYCLG